MNDEYDEYWDGYGEFNNEIDSFRESLKTAVKKEITDELAKLRTENRDLRDKVANLDSLEKEAQNKIRQAQNELDTATHRAASMKADEMFKYLEETKYIVTRVPHDQPKCGKCNDDRKLPFIYPSGKEGHEMCECAKAKYEWEPGEAIGTSIDIRNRDLMIWYRPYSTREDDYHSMSGDIKKPYNGEDFETIESDKYKILFNDKATASRFAAYLNTLKTN